MSVPALAAEVTLAKHVPLVSGSNPGFTANLNPVNTPNTPPSVTTPPTTQAAPYNFNNTITSTAKALSAFGLNRYNYATGNNIPPGPR